jgi:hypothetical protein
LFSSQAEPPKRFPIVRFILPDVITWIRIVFDFYETPETISVGSVIHHQIHDYLYVLMGFLLNVLKSASEP